MGYRLSKRYKKLEILGYVDNNYTSNLKNRKSTIKYYYFFSKAIVT